jgi:AcrR family transcriptional regulator
MVPRAFASAAIPTLAGEPIYLCYLPFYGSQNGMSAQVQFFRVEVPSEGLRSRKKAKTRMMIEDVALRLFAEQGYEATTVEQIADEVEISTTTFFRYFPSKADVVLSHQDANMPQLREAILAYPPGESDLSAVEHAINLVWVPNADPVHSQRAGQAVATSVSLRGLYNEMSRNWLEGIAEALAERRGLGEPDIGAIITARVALGVFNEAVRAWGNNGYKAGVGAEVDRAFAKLRQLSAEWAK